MGEDNQTELGAEPTFAEAKGSESNQHAKKLAKKKSAEKKKAKSSEEYYSVKGDKVLKYSINDTGLYSIYIGSMKKHGDALKAQIAKWKKDGKWIEPHQLDAKKEEFKKKKA